MPDINVALRDFRRQAPTIERADELRSALGSIATQHYSNDPHLALATRLIEHVFSTTPSTVDVGQLALDDAAYAWNIMAMREHVKGRVVVEPIGSAISEAPSSLDFLVNTINQWSLLKTINFALLLAIPPVKRAAIVTTIRNEGISILEWVAHHRSLGFEQIFVYTNNNTDGSNPLLEKLAHHELIRLIYNDVDSHVPPQTKAYEHSLHFLPELRQYRWAFYIDADEFFIPRCGANLHLDDFFEALSIHYGAALPAAVSFNWKWFGSENAFERTGGLLLNRFEHSIHNEHVKTLMQLQSVVTMKPVHCPVMFADCFAVDSQFNRLAAVTTQTTPVYGTGQINHYWNKSFKEFVLKKYRGRAAVGTDGSQREFSMFFDWGANDRRGNYDPPPSVIVNRTQEAYRKLVALPGVVDDLLLIDKLLDDSIDVIDRDIDLRRIYDNRGLVEN